MLIWGDDPKPYRPRFLPSRCKPVHRSQSWWLLALWAFLWTVTTVIIRSVR